MGTGKVLQDIIGIERVDTGFTPTCDQRQHSHREFEKISEACQTNFRRKHAEVVGRVLYEDAKSAPRGVRPTDR